MPKLTKISPVMLPFMFMFGVAVLVFLPSCIKAEEKKEESKAVASTENSGAMVSMAVVDVQALLNDSEAALSIKKQATDLRDAYQKEFEGLEKKLRDTEKDFVARKEKLSEEEIVKERQKFEKQLSDAQTQVKKRKKQLEDSIAVATGELRNQILEIVATLSAQRGYELVISRQDVVIVSKDIDITKEVLDTLNDKLKTVKLDIKDVQ